MINRFRCWFSFEQCDRDILVPDGDAVFKFEFFSQSERALEPFGTLLGIANRQTKMPDFPKRKRNFHLNSPVPDCGMIDRPLNPLRSRWTKPPAPGSAD